MKSIIKDHNKRNKANPIRLNFEIEDQDHNEDRIVKGKEIDDEDLNEWWRLREAFTTRYSTRKACYKETHEITKIVRKANETCSIACEMCTEKAIYSMVRLHHMFSSPVEDRVLSHQKRWNDRYTAGAKSRIVEDESARSTLERIRRCTGDGVLSWSQMQLETDVGAV
ncbi:hypothetical protein Tco_1174006 [Tanacetum coccineum]